MKYVSLLLWIVVVFITIIFASMNSHSVSLYYYFGSVKVLLPLLMILQILLGLLLGSLAMLPAYIRVRAKNRKLNQKLLSVELEVKNLRSIPIKDDH